MEAISSVFTAHRHAFRVDEAPSPEGSDETAHLMRRPSLDSSLSWREGYTVAWTE
jgi:hypothetical protein